MSAAPAGARTAPPPGPADAGGPGRTTVPDRVLAKIARRAAVEAGAVGRGSGTGVRVRRSGTGVSVAVSVALPYPGGVLGAARAVRDRVARRLREYAGAEVLRVDVEVASLAVRRAPAPAAGAAEEAAGEPGAGGEDPRWGRP
ncbi:hypothetical protein J0910_19465 [Nocardiopsis sp. CNT-189]|uniref:hypothetical protein n=1 Tax=Nocardiopsis oceanisediminis TaxID=2816862 RepID=UPI003B34C424